MPSPSNVSTSICNEALSFIKQAQITTLQDTNERARKCALFYDKARRETLRSCDWNFAKKHQALTLLGSMNASDFDPSFQTLQDVVPGWIYLYAQPGKCIRVQKVFSPTSPRSTGPFFDAQGNPIGTVYDRSRDVAAQNKYLCCRSPKTDVLAVACDVELAWAAFTFDVVDESQFDDLFVTAFAYELAKKLCLPLTADKELLTLIDQDRREFIGEAKRKNGGEGTEELVRVSNYEAARDQ